MKRLLMIRVIWCDDDVYELTVVARSGSFAGTANVYVAHGELRELPEMIAGFPFSNSDRREITLGSFDTKHAGGAVRLTLQCLDAVGHPAIGVEICSKSSIQDEGTASFKIPFEPAALDRFVDQFRDLNRGVGAEAVLQA